MLNLSGIESLLEIILCFVGMQKFLSAASIVSSKLKFGFDGLGEGETITSLTLLLKSPGQM